MKIVAGVILAAIGFTISARAYSAAMTQGTTPPGVVAGRFAFANDDGAHTAFPSERWQLSGRLQTAVGEHLSYQLTFWRYSKPLPTGGDRSDFGWRSTTMYPAALAITDEDTREFSYAERLGRPVLGIADARSNGLNVHVDGWRLAAERSGRLASIASESHLGINLSHIAIEPRVAHGQKGVFAAWPCVSCSTTFLSYPRLSTQGKIVFRDKTFAVTGTSWLDHEFGNHALATDMAGWQRFELQLDDGRELMLFMIRRRNGAIDQRSSGTIVDRKGHPTHLAFSQFTAEDYGGQTWKSPHSPASYPVLWRISIPSAGLLFSASPLAPDQELYPSAGGVPYWSGSVGLQGEMSGTRIGSGFVELTGYTSPVSF